MKNVLVLGGSYFVGRVFSILSSRRGDMKLHVLNRGRYTLDLPNVTEYKCDRKDIDKLSGLLPDIKFDAVVDFCAYNPGEIAPIIEALAPRLGQYIFLSTSSVYLPEDRVKKEGDPVVESTDGSPVSDYIYNKVLLERELAAASEKAGIPYTILRPTFIYGPYNYAPRESYYVELIVKGEAVPLPIDASSKFQFVYVSDIAGALHLIIGNERAYNEVFNLAAPEVIDYKSFTTQLAACSGGPIKTKDVTVQEVIAQNIPLPFPLDTDDLCSGEKFSDTFSFTYTPFPEGMQKAFDAFKSVFSS